MVGGGEALRFDRGYRSLPKSTRRSCLVSHSKFPGSPRYWFVKIITAVLLNDPVAVKWHARKPSVTSAIHICLHWQVPLIDQGWAEVNCGRGICTPPKFHTGSPALETRDNLTHCAGQQPFRSRSSSCHFTPQVPLRRFFTYQRLPTWAT